MRTFIGLAIVALFLGTAGCGNGGNGGSAGSAISASAETQPEGKNLDLLGSWFAADPFGPVVIGLEFIEGERVIVTTRQQSGELSSRTAEYTVLDDQRVNLVRADGQSTMYRCERQGDRLVLIPLDGEPQWMEYERATQGVRDLYDAHRQAMKREDQPQEEASSAELRDAFAAAVSEFFGALTQGYGERALTFILPDDRPQARRELPTLIPALRDLGALEEVVLQRVELGPATSSIKAELVIQGTSNRITTGLEVQAVGSHWYFRWPQNMTD